MGSRPRNMPLQVITSGLGERMAEVERLYLGGVQGTAEIARQLQMGEHEVGRTIALLKEYWARKYDTENMRKALSLQVEGIMQEATDRYMPDDGRKGPTKEGRLALEAAGRLSKMHGIEETISVQTIGEAFGKVIAAYQKQKEEVVEGEFREVKQLEVSNEKDS